jgi:hypothetical protein
MLSTDAERATVAEVAVLMDLREGRVVELLAQLRVVRRLAGVKS